MKRLNPWSELATATAGMAAVAIAAIAGAWAAYWIVGLTVRAWLWLLLHALPYWLAVVPAFALAAWTLWRAWRLLLWILPPSRQGSRDA